MVNLKNLKLKKKGKLLNDNRGITLIALVITIIVLLILAGISISMLTGENGLLTKASDAKTKKLKAEIIERARLDISNQITENQGSNITKEQLMSILDKYFENVQNIELSDDLADSNILLKAKVNYGGFDDIKLIDIYNGTIYSKSTICFNGKNVNEVNVGDDFTIGIRKTRASNLEKFQVIKKEGSIITAIPYYNITINEDNLVQRGASDTTKFSKNEYINNTGIINMEEDGNEIKKYIDAYRINLERLGAKNITTRVALYEDLSNISESQRNPSKKGSFWLGSALKDGNTYAVRIIDSSGKFSKQTSYSDNEKWHHGVRPLVEIDTSGLDYITNISETSNYKTGDIKQKLIDLINYEDYGKNIDYSVTVNGKSINNWKIFFNDGNNVYIVLDEYLEANLMPKGTNIAKDISKYKYNVWSGRDNASPLYDWLKNESIWSEFASGMEGATATGSPTVKQLNKSLNRTFDSKESVSGNLYITNSEPFENCKGYWLCDYYTFHASSYCRFVNYNGSIGGDESATSKTYSVKPIICLPSNVEGTVTDSVHINK